MADLKSEILKLTPAARVKTRAALLRLLGYVARPMPQGARFHIGVVQT